MSAYSIQLLLLRVFVCNLKGVALAYVSIFILYSKKLCLFVCLFVCTALFLRDYLLNLSILVSRGKYTNKYSLSSGERMESNSNLNLRFLIEGMLVKRVIHKQFLV